MKKISEPFKITSKDGRVFGFYNPNGTIRILKNSFFRMHETNTLLPVYKNIRGEILNGGYVSNEIFIKDYIFKNACEAYCCCYGRQDNGTVKFYTIDNIELDVYLKRIGEVNQKILVCNVTWMENYSGKEAFWGSNWKYVKENGFGHEFMNFYNDKGYYYGFTNMNNGKINLKRIDPNATENFIDDVLVVWISKNPSGSLTIVGYYKNARVYGSIQPYDLNIDGYYFKAKVEDSYLIPVDKRNFEFPKDRFNRPGQASVWYADNDILKEDIINYINEIDNNRLHFVKERYYIEKDDEISIVSTSDLTSKDEEYNPKYEPVKKPKKKENSSTSYARDSSKAKGAIISSKYKCNLDESHKSFIAKSGKPYMEAHHLIPISAQDKFDVSLDVDANIVCLCPNCHRNLHYGQDITNLLRTLYDEKKEYLKKSGIIITFEELLELYK